MLRSRSRSRYVLAGRIAAAVALLSLATSPIGTARAGKPPRPAAAPRRGASPDSAASATAVRPAPPRPEPGLLRTTAGLSAVRLANGAMMLDLQGRYREYVVARIAPDGTVSITCVHGATAVHRALDPGAAPASARYEER